jgi:hypothetical protein
VDLPEVVSLKFYYPCAGHAASLTHALTHSTQLTHLQLHCSDYSDGLAPRLVLAACGAPQLPELQTLLLLGRCPHDLPNVFANLSYMQRLTRLECSLVSPEAQRDANSLLPLVTGLRTLRNLRHLNIGYWPCSLQVTAWADLPASLAQLRGLTSLRLYDLAMGPDCTLWFDTLSTSLPQLSNLQSLDIVSDEARLGGPGPSCEHGRASCDKPAPGCSGRDFDAVDAPRTVWADPMPELARLLHAAGKSRAPGHPGARFPAHVSPGRRGCTGALLCDVAVGYGKAKGPLSGGHETRLTGGSVLVHRAIPTLTALVSLDLGCNELGPYRCSLLALAVCSLPRLRTISISGVTLYQAGGWIRGRPELPGRASVFW